MYDNYYSKEIYENTNTIIEQNQDIIENQNTLIEQNGNGLKICLALGVIITAYVIHHLFDAGWKKY